MKEPRFIELDDAISRIKQACEKPSKDSSPFFFLVGAGISYPSVPLAADIVASCKLVAETHRRSAPATTNAIDAYSQWFQTAYAEPYQRQEYLRELIEGKPITHANFRLAHLLLNNTISNIVVTTNFDDFLARALTLFGKSHIVCDHPQTVGRINHNQPIAQVVHLHGSYWFYDCCNLRDELEDRAQQSQQTTLTMASLLDMILWDRSPLIIGYSGWEGDVFTEALRRRLVRPLRSNAYWFCYRRTDVESLPDWLKYHPNISFVIPKEKPALERVSEADAASLRRIKSTESSTEKDTQPLLPADTVLDRLIQAFNLAAPELTKDPLGFFARHLNNSLPKDPASNTDTDIYAIKGVIERVRKAKQRDDEESARAIVEPAESQLEQVRDALRRADYREAVRRCSQIDLETLSAKDLDELADAMWSAARGLADNSEEELSAYDWVVVIRDLLVNKFADQTPAARLQIVNSLSYKGIALGVLNRKEEEIAVYDDLLQRFGDATDPALREHVARTLRNKGFILGGLSRCEEEIAVYDDLLQRFEDATEPALRDHVATALRNKGVALGELNRSDEEIAVYDEVVRRYGDATELDVQENVATALRNKGVVLQDLNRNEEAIAVYDDLLQRYGDASEPDLQENLATALLNKGVTLEKLNRNEEANAIYDDVFERYGDATEPDLQETVARALVNKGNILGELKRSKEAVAAYEEVVQRYRDVDTPALQKQVGLALNDLGFEMLISAKALLLAADREAAAKELGRANDHFDAALKRVPANAAVIGNQAYTAFLQGRKEEARELLSKAIAIGGEHTRAGELADADINRLPEDDEFCELVRSIPAS